MGHFNILRLCNRPFTDIETMNETILENFNSKVAPGDQVYFLGDFCLNHNFLKMYLPKFNGRWTFLFGNHDAIFRKPNLRKQYEILGAVVMERLVIERNDQRYLMCHLPWMNPEAIDQRYMEKRPRRQDYPNHILLHGHSHSKPDKRLRIDSLDVGVDGNNFSPYNLEEIEELFKV